MMTDMDPEDLKAYVKARFRIKRGPQVEEKKAELSIRGETKPESLAPRKLGGKSKAGGMMNRKRQKMTRHTFQAYLTAGPWKASDQGPVAMTNGKYTTWIGPSRIKRGTKAVFLQAGNNIIEAPTWSVMAKRLNLL